MEDYDEVHTSAICGSGSRFLGSRGKIEGLMAS